MTTKYKQLSLLQTFCHPSTPTTYIHISNKTSYEKNYDPVPISDWMEAHPLFPIVACLLYAIFIVLGQGYFETRERLHWRYTMAKWNLFLSIFSFLGMIRTSLQLGHNLYIRSIHDNFCQNPQTAYGSGSTGLWVQLFILSKFPYVLFYITDLIYPKRKESQTLSLSLTSLPFW